MHVAFDLGEQHDAEAEHPRKDDAQQRVFLDPAVLLQIADAERAGHPGYESSDRQRQSGDIGQHYAGQDRMADRIAHQGPALQHQKTGQERGGHRYAEPDQESLLHEFEREGREGVHHCVADTSRRRRRAAKRPCLGANRKAIRNRIVCRTTITPPVAPSRK